MVRSYKSFCSLKLFFVNLFFLGCLLSYGHGQTDYAESKPNIRVRSGGSTFATDVYKIWRAMYLSQRAAHIDLTLTYQAVGSGTGVRRFRENLFDFAGTDIVPRESDYNGTDDLQMFPTMAGPVSVTYNLPDLSKSCSDYTIKNNPACLNLTREAIVGIFNGSIRFWNDTSITIHNPTLMNVSEPIVVVVRADSSGTTSLFTTALASFNPAWRRTYGVFSDGCSARHNPVKWNATLNLRCGATSFGASGLILTTPYSIGYCTSSEARDSSLSEARILNRFGRWIGPSVEGTKAAMENQHGALGHRLTGSIIDSDEQEAYPIAGYTYFVIRKRSMTNCTVAEEIYRYCKFVLEDPLARSIVSDLVKAPVTDSITELIGKHVFGQMECKGQSVADLVRATIARETGQDQAWKVPTAIGTAIVFVILLIVAIMIGYSEYARNRNVIKQTYILQLDSGSSRDAGKSAPSLASTEATSHGANAGTRSGYKVAKLVGGERVLTKALCGHFDVNTLQWKTKKQLVRFKDELSNPNLVKLMGIGKSEDGWVLVTAWPKKGTLQNVIHGGKYKLNTNFRYSIAKDIAEGMAYLHKTEIACGHLTTSTCFVDARWNVQIGEWEQVMLHSTQRTTCTIFERAYNDVQKTYPGDVEALNDYYRMLYYVAPETVEQDSRNLFYAWTTTKAADVYSFGIVAYEVFTNVPPFENLHASEESTRWLPLNIVTAIKTVGIRPSIPDEMWSEFEPMVDVVKQCWDEDAYKRPSFTQLVKYLKAANPKHESVIDTMMQAVETYANSLEEKVNERTRELEKITANMKTLLYNMLPPAIADKLSKGEHVEPEFYESVTICFTDIVGFTGLAAISKPLQIVELLNDLYTSFDSVITSHPEVYKVETIGDSYMCVSGLPKRNGNLHGMVIADMELDMLSIVSSIPIRHMPDKVLKIRAGSHTGGAMAGIVGSKMPRFCLFGDSVNTASRMESSSLPMRIQISEEHRAVLLQAKAYELHLRGERDVKGKGTMTTYWLTGKRGYHKPLPVFNPEDDDEDLSKELDPSQIK